MKRYHKLMSFFSFLFGIVALIAILINDKKDRLYSFYIWQAFLLNLVLGVAYAIYSVCSVYYIINKVLIIKEIGTTFFLKFALIPIGIIGVIIILLFTLGIMAYKEIKFDIPLIGKLAKKITKQGVR